MFGAKLPRVSWHGYPDSNPIGLCCRNEGQNHSADAPHFDADLTPVPLRVIFRPWSVSKGVRICFPNILPVPRILPTAVLTHPHGTIRPTTISPVSKLTCTILPPASKIGK